MRKIERRFFTGAAHHHHRRHRAHRHPLHGHRLLHLLCWHYRHGLQHREHWRSVHHRLGRRRLGRHSLPPTSPTATEPSTIACASSGSRSLTPTVTHASTSIS